MQHVHSQGGWRNATGGEGVVRAPWIPRPKLDAYVVDDDAVKEAKKTKRFKKMQKNLHRGQGSKNSSGKRTRQPPPPPVRVKRRAGALLCQNEGFSSIQWKVLDLTNEQTLLVNKRQPDNWAKSMDKMEGMVLAQTSGHITGGSRRVLYQKCNVTLYQWFSAHHAQNLPVSARMLTDEAQRLAQPGEHILSRRWLEKFRKRHHIVL